MMQSSRFQNMIELLFRPGASLRGWRDFFLNAQVVGLDIYPAAMLEQESRITTHICNSLIRKQVERVLAKETTDGLFDIVVEDGLHSGLA